MLFVTHRADLIGEAVALHICEDQSVTFREVAVEIVLPLLRGCSYLNSAVIGASAQSAGIFGRASPISADGKGRIESRYFDYTDEVPAVDRDRRHCVISSFFGNGVVRRRHQ